MPGMAEDALIRRENLVRLGKAPSELVKILGRTNSYWSDLIRGPKSFGEKIARSIEADWPLPRGWLDDVHDDNEPVPAPGNKGISLAQTLSHAAPTLTPQQLVWEDLMGETLPASFSLKLRDDALGDLFPRGALALFETGRPPISGRAVLFRDRDGEMFVRNYQERRGQHWLAIAAPEAASKYAPLDSEADGLTVVAVMVGVRWA